MKQGVLYLQLQQTFGKVRRGRGGVAAWSLGRTHRRGGLGWAGHGGVRGLSKGTGMLPPIGSPATHRLSASILGDEDGQGVEDAGVMEQRDPPQLDPPGRGSAELCHALMQTPEPGCFSG